jgi:hypothetical protein
MLTIAGGIILAAIVLAFWREIVYIIGMCLGVAALLIAISYLYNIR